MIEWFRKSMTLDEYYNVSIGGSMTQEIKPLSEEELDAYEKEAAKPGWASLKRFIVTIRQLQEDGENLHAKMRELETVISKKDKDIARLKAQLSQVRREQIESDFLILKKFYNEEIRQKYGPAAGVLWSIAEAQKRICSQLTPTGKEE